MRPGAAAAILAWLLCAPAAIGAAGPGAIRFEPAEEKWGLLFRHHHGGSGRRYMMETVIGGTVVFDYDGDGDGDVLFVDGASLPGYDGEAPRTRLFRNDLGRFVDVSESAGLDFDGYGNGGTAGDVDGDGDVDLYLTALGPNALLANRGDGRFEAVPDAGGAADPGWSTGAAFADVDGDGDLDLYVAGYVEYTVAGHRPCITEGHEIYCHPNEYPGAPDRFYLNRGDGRFDDQSAAAGLARTRNQAGLGVLFTDLDRDGRPDLFVANDSSANFLYRNLGSGTFEDVSLLAGVAYSDAGRPEAGMGVDAADINGDGTFDIVVANFELETNAVYSYLGDWLFTDVRWASGVAEPSLMQLTFGVALADFDHDADVDLVSANGHILDNAALIVASSRYAQPNAALENLGSGRFREVVASGIERVFVSRGLATGDLDLDGDLDLVIVNSNDLAEVYENVGAAGAWVTFEPVTAEGAPAIGTVVEVESHEAPQLRELRTGSSYLSQHEARLHFGLGSAARVPPATIIWPDGKRQRLDNLPVARRLKLAPR